MVSKNDVCQLIWGIDQSAFPHLRWDLNSSRLLWTRSWWWAARDNCMLHLWWCDSNIAASLLLGLDLLEHFLEVTRRKQTNLMCIVLRSKGICNFISWALWRQACLVAWLQISKAYCWLIYNPITESLNWRRILGFALSYNKIAIIIFLCLQKWAERFYLLVRGTHLFILRHSWLRGHLRYFIPSFHPDIVAVLKISVDTQGNDLVGN